MDLALLVYGISVIKGIPLFLMVILVITSFAVIGQGIYTSFVLDDIRHYGNDKQILKRNEVKRKLYKRKFARLLKYAIAIFLTVTFLRVVIPDEKTMYMMVGAYAAQQVAENPDVKRISGKVITAIEKKLDEYVEEAEREVEKAVKK